jgi:hypothetical protein
MTANSMHGESAENDDPPVEISFRGSSYRQEKQRICPYVRMNDGINPHCRFKKRNLPRTRVTSHLSIGTPNFGLHHPRRRAASVLRWRRR